MNNLNFKQLNDDLYSQLFSKKDLAELSEFMSNTKPISNEIIAWFSVFEEESLLGSYWIESRVNKVFIGLFVLPPFRGNSYGKSILKEILSIGKKHSIDEIYLNVRENNINAIKLYEAAGFSKTKNFMNSRGISALEFCLKL